MSLQQGDSTAHVHMNSMNRETIESYSNLLDDTLREHSLFDSPAQIYNMDESSISLNPHTPNVIARRGQKTVSLQDFWLRC